MPLGLGQALIPDKTVGRVKAGTWGHRFRSGMNKLWFMDPMWPTACFAKKVVLEHSHAHLCTPCLGLLLHYKDRVESS